MKTWLKILLLLFVTALTAVVLVYFFVYNKPHPDYEFLEPDYIIEAETLYMEFMENPEQAQQKYNGKIIQLTGIVDRIEQPEEMVVLCFDFREGFFGMEGIRATMLENFHDAALELAPGTNITLKGFCSGFDESVILEHCSLVAE